ncbi:MAG: type II toxin-antitoxin system ParD family antitoxin [Hyphomicrobiales bacterium]
MGHMDKRSVTLSEELAQTVDAAVAAGEYASASDVISDALRQWKERRDLHGYTVEELRRLIQDGIDSGPSLDGYQTMDGIIAEAHRRAERAGKVS